MTTTPLHSSNHGLARSLKERHVMLIAIGGIIGAGLFLGSGKAIATAGPALLLAYALCGGMVYLIARALGELSLYRPSSGSFATYAEEFLGPRVAFITGWSYWMIWILVGVLEVTGIGLLMKYWYPELPQWIPALVTVGVLMVINLFAVKTFGEVEFWLALIKVLTIVGLIVAGLVILLFGLETSAQTAPSVANLWRHAGFFPNGWSGFWFAVPVAAFTFAGVEVVGLVAAETAQPQRTLPRAINSILWRMAIFYLGSTAVIMALYPWNQIDTAQSPFVMVFDSIGLGMAAGLINFVVISALASSCNTGLFATSRMLFALSHLQQAPRQLQVLSPRQVPARCLMISTAILLVGVLLNYWIPESIFSLLMTGILGLLIWVWVVIITAHMAYRRKVRRNELKEVHYRLPWPQVSSVLVLGYLGVLTVLVIRDPETRAAFYVAAAWFALLMLVYPKRAASKKGVSDAWNA
ncbi:amino acid permease [Pseudomonas palleroniana]|uniref:D-alanine/D-serine/glycine permease n=1 Tax=Pseudomonas palleroniana TaxID=191390 RepID=A0A0X7K2F7_9PSED|nr:amino acid permease [Pseudomonas palleroniana]KWU49881.1 D-alanine/D-serine/glycine permease [Pseudomonas palleroniana]